jgi:hypothetical protein
MFTPAIRAKAVLLTPKIKKVSKKTYPEPRGGIIERKSFLSSPLSN